MGTFHAKCRIENPVDRTRSAVLPKLLVDTGSEYTWVSDRTLERIGIQREKKDVAFVLANGQHVTRSVGFAIIRLDKFFTIDEVVFAERGDLLLLGARTLEGLNLTIDPRRKKLVAAGPLPAASSIDLLEAHGSRHLRRVIHQQGVFTDAEKLGMVKALRG
jgi:predicted aspartyl protease